MPNPVLIVHGWSDNYESFKPLKAWFNANGYTAEQVESQCHWANTRSCVQYGRAAVSPH